MVSLSEAAKKLARHLVHISADGLSSPISWSLVLERYSGTNASLLAEAAFELEQGGFVTVSKAIGAPDGIARLRPDYSLFWTFDEQEFGFDSASDAATLAAMVLEDEAVAHSPEAEKRTGWPKRRLNPAIALLGTRIPEQRTRQVIQNDYPTLGFAITAEDRVALRRLVEEKAAVEEDPSPRGGGIRVGDGKTRILPALETSVTTYDPATGDVVGRRREPTEFAEEVSRQGGGRIGAHEVAGWLKRGARVSSPGEEFREAFLCHASEDKADVVEPLRDALEAAGVRCWYDQAEIAWGDSLTAKVNEGMKVSRFVLVVLSPAFLRKPWARRELDAATNLEASTVRVRVLPLLCGNSSERASILEEFPLLNDKAHLVWSGDPGAVVVEMLRRLDVPER